MARHGFTLMELIVVLLILGGLAALLVPAMGFSFRHVHERNCGSNLSQLVKAMYNYSITRSPAEGGFPSGTGFTGGSFWTTLYSTKEIDDPWVLVCPLSGTGSPDGTHTDYRGPRSDPNVLPAKGVLGCDKMGNHGPDPAAAMYWVDKSADWHKLPGDVVEWFRILRETCN